MSNPPSKISDERINEIADSPRAFAVGNYNDAWYMARELRQARKVIKLHEYILVNLESPDEDEAFEPISKRINRLVEQFKLLNP